jgi:CYTH domain-containing protein
MASAPEHSIEIERKYLLDRAPALPAGAVAWRLEQGYLNGERGRLRRTVKHDGTIVCTHTVKEGRGLVRRETERTLTLEEFDAAWPRTEGRRLTKTRHLVREGDLVWAIDCYDDLDLVVAEVEIPSADTEVAPPAWLRPCVVREVTGDPAYQNYELALRMAGGRRRRPH